jgi:hypothetical protein
MTNNRISAFQNDQRQSWRDVLPVHPAADVFPRMSEAELRDLAKDIKQHGLKNDVVIYRDSSSKLWLLDGRSRLDAEEANGSKLVKDDGTFDGDFQTIYVDKVDPYAYVVSANIHRRHLTAEQKRDTIAALLKADPTKSDRAIAKVAKADNKTVASVRAEKERREEIPHVKSRADTKGRKQPAKKQKAAKVKPEEGEPQIDPRLKRSLESKISEQVPIAPTATTAKSWKVEATVKDGKQYGNGIRFRTQEEADAYRATNATHDLMRENGVIVITTDVLPSADVPTAEKMRFERGRFKGQFKGDVNFLHGTCGTFDWEEIAAPAKVELKPKVQQRPIQIIDDGTDGADQGDGPQQFWERSLANVAGIAISLEEFWTRQHGAAWRDFPVSRDLATLARKAADVWSSLAEQLDARVVPVTPTTDTDDYPDLPASLNRALWGAAA